MAKIDWTAGFSQQLNYCIGNACEEFSLRCVFVLL